MKFQFSGRVTQRYVRMIITIIKIEIIISENKYVFNKIFMISSIYLVFLEMYIISKVRMIDYYMVKDTNDKTLPFHMKTRPRNSLVGFQL